MTSSKGCVWFLHGHLCIASYARHHHVDSSTSSIGPTIINASGSISWNIIYYLHRRISCGAVQLLGAVAKASHHLTAAEERQVPHDTIPSRHGLQPGQQVHLSRLYPDPMNQPGDGRELCWQAGQTHSGPGSPRDMLRQGLWHCSPNRSCPVT